MTTTSADTGTTVSQTTSETSSETTSAATETTTTEASQTTKPEQESAPVDFPEKLYLDEFINEELRPELDDIVSRREEFSETNSFIDFQLVNPEEADIPENSRINAENAVLESEIYENEKQYIELFMNDGEINEKYISDGEIVPHFLKGYEQDYDGNGTSERFLLVTLPDSYTTDRVRELYVLLFENSDGELTILDRIAGLNEPEMADYGDFKHMFIGGTGDFGVESHSFLYGADGNEAVKFFEIRGGIGKNGCFMNCAGWQGASCTMIFDTTDKTYRAFTGVKCDLDKIMALDTEGVIQKYLDAFNSDTGPEGYIFGERYLLVRAYPPLDPGQTYRYEDGHFIPVGEYYSDFTANMFWLEDKIYDIDVDYAYEASGTEPIRELVRSDIYGAADTEYTDELQN